MSGPSPPPQCQGTRRQPRRRQRGAPFSLPRPPSLAAALGQCSSPPCQHPGRERGNPGSLLLALMTVARLVPPSGTPAPGSRLAPLLFWEDLAVPTGVSGTARVPTMAVPTGCGKETFVRPKHGPASLGCQRVGIPRARPLSIFISSAPLSGFVSPYSKWPRASPPLAPSLFSCRPGFASTDPGRPREDGRGVAGRRSPPAPLPLPLLPVWAGLPEASQAFEAEGSRVGPPPSWGVGRPPREEEDRGKACPPALAEVEGAQHHH